jgi:hypothetical protein
MLLQHDILVEAYLKNECMTKQPQTGKNIEPLISPLSSTDDKIRIKAPKSLKSVGKSVVSSLSVASQNLNVFNTRWEVNKPYGDVTTSLIKVLEHFESDVVWLAKKAMKKIRKTAWPELLNELIQRGTQWAMLGDASQHLFSKQTEAGFNDLVAFLSKKLKAGAVAKSTSMAAESNIFKRMKEE